MRRSTVSIFLVALFAWGMTACSGSSKSQKETAETPTETSTEAPAEDAESAEMAEPADDSGDESVGEEAGASAEASATTESPLEAAKTGDDLKALFTVTGAVEKNAVKGVIGKKKSSVYDCYSAELENNPGLSGQVLVKITSSASGDVVSAMVKDSTLNNQAVQSCLTKTIREWKFPQPTDGGLVMIEYAFSFPP